MSITVLLVFSVPVREVRRPGLMLWRRHTDQLKTCTESGDSISWPARSAPLPDRSDQIFAPLSDGGDRISPTECPDYGMAIDARPQLSEGTTAPVDQQYPSVSPKPAIAVATQVASPAQEQSNSGRRYPLRERKLPDRFDHVTLLIY